jgi:hypothetical protein
MPGNGDPQKKLLQAILRAKKDKLTVDEFVTVAEVLGQAGKDRLLKHITWFLMGTIASTFGLWVLGSIGKIHLSNGALDKIASLFCVQLAVCLGTVITSLVRDRKTRK